MQYCGNWATFARLFIFASTPAMVGQLRRESRASRGPVAGLPWTSAATVLPSRLRPSGEGSSSGRSTSDSARAIFLMAREAHVVVRLEGPGVPITPNIEVDRRVDREESRYHRPIY